MRLNFTVLLALLAALTVLVGAPGGYFAMRMGWPGGFSVVLTAGVTVFAVMIASGLIVMRAAAKGPGKASMVFMAMGMIRPVLCLIIACAAWGWLHLPPKTLAIWLVVFYILSVVVETIWLAKALMRDSQVNPRGQPRREAVTEEPGVDSRV